MSCQDLVEGDEDNDVSAPHEDNGWAATDENGTFYLIF